jgi:hypothetical protein
MLINCDKFWLVACDSRHTAMGANKVTLEVKAAKRPPGIARAARAATSVKFE